MSKFGPLYKILVIVSIVAVTFGYALFQKNQYWASSKDDNELILAKLPNFDAKILDSGFAWDSKAELAEAKGLMVHFWGTWCAPCEAEFPELLKFAGLNADKKLKFLLLAVNDDQGKVKAFLKRFKLPENVTIALDEKGASMPLFGTVKVPETYLFDASGIHLNKYVGPQDWANPVYLDQIGRLLAQTP